MSPLPITLIISYSGKKLRKLRVGPSRGEPRLFPRILNDLDVLRVPPPDCIEVIGSCERFSVPGLPIQVAPRSVVRLEARSFCESLTEVLTHGIMQQKTRKIVTSLQYASQTGSSLKNACELPPSFMGLI